MKTKSKMIASIMSICLVCAVFAIGVFALKTANLKIGGDVSFTATGVEASIFNASVTNSTGEIPVLENFDITTAMNQAQIQEKMNSWDNIPISFDEEGKNIVLSMDIKNNADPNSEKDNYIYLDYNYTFSTNGQNQNVDIFPGANNNYILEPGEQTTLELSVEIINKELDVGDCSVDIEISLVHTEPEVLTETSGSYYDASGIKYTVETVDGKNVATASGSNWTATYPSNLIFPSVVQVDDVNYIVRTANMLTAYSYTMDSIIFPNGMKVLGNGFFRPLTCNNVFFGKGISEISTYSFAFALNYYADEFVVPNWVTSIGDYAFYGAYKIKSINIHKNVTSIGANVFAFAGNTMQLSSAYFQDPTGWYVADTADATEGTPVTEITAEASEVNAILLKETYVDKYWFKSNV